jgi:hypothetical protein
MEIGVETTTATEELHCMAFLHSGVYEDETVRILFHFGQDKNFVQYKPRAQPKALLGHMVTLRYVFDAINSLENMHCQVTS